MPVSRRNEGLSEREVDVLTGLMLGRSNKAIAAALNASDMTVKVHVKAILRKLRVSTRTQAATLVMRAALFAPCPRCGFTGLSVARLCLMVVAAVLLLAGFYLIGGWAEHEADRLAGGLTPPAGPVNLPALRARP